MKRFLPYSSYLNVDEVEDIEKVWNFVAEKVGEDTDVLKNKILPLPRNTVIHPGHGLKTTVSKARKEFEIFSRRVFQAPPYGDVLWAE